MLTETVAAAIEVDQEVRVLPLGLIMNYGAPPGGWVGHITKITPKQVHIKYGDITDVFDRRSQRIRYGDIARKFRTLPQMEMDERRRAAGAILREHGIELSKRRNYSLEQVEALAEVARTWPAGQDR